MKIKRNTKSIYVIENMENGRVKIGVSNNPKQRVKSLMCQSGCMMTVKYESHQIENFSQVESSLHSMFIEKRYVGEWFNVSVKESIAAVKSLVRNRHDCIIVRKFEEGVAIGEIARLQKVSRTAIVNYLQSKGYRPKDRKGRTIKKATYIPAKPQTPSLLIEKSSLEKMVERNNKKITERKSKKRIKI